jgi:hypothetical protein
LVGINLEVIQHMRPRSAGHKIDVLPLRFIEQAVDHRTDQWERLDWLPVYLGRERFGHQAASAINQRFSPMAMLEASIRMSQPLRAG